MSDEIEYSEPFCIELDGKGGMIPRACDKYHKNSKKKLWYNLDYMEASTKELLLEEFGLDEDVVEALTETQTRPRYFSYGEGIVFILRAVNPYKKAQSTDMLSFRVWVDEHKIITLYHRKIKAIDAVIDELQKKKGPTDTVECFVECADKIATYLEKTIGELSYKVDAIESEVTRMSYDKKGVLRGSISNIRRRIVAMRRYLVPNRDVFANIKNEKIDIIKKKHRIKIREIGNTLTKAIEDLDYARDHLTVSHEEILGKASVRMSEIMYKLSLVTTIFLPMTAISSVLGANVKGIPFADEPYAFTVLAVVLVTICFGIVALFRKFKWL